MTYDPIRRRVVLFGGDSATGPLGDTWEWDGAWTQRASETSPGNIVGRYGHAMTFDQLGGRSLMFGGTYDGPFDSAFRVWDPDASQWTSIGDDTGLAARTHQTAAWDNHRNTLIIFGGVFGDFMAGTPIADGCEWNGSCAPIPTGPDARSGHLMFTLGDGGVMVMGGDAVLDGVIDADLDDSWRLRYESSSAYEICSSNVDNDGDGKAGCADEDCWPTCTPLCPPTATTCPDRPRCGDGTCDSSRENCRNCAADCSCPIVCGDLVCDPGETCAGDCP